MTDTTQVDDSVHPEADSGEVQVELTVWIGGHRWGLSRTVPQMGGDPAADAALALDMARRITAALEHVVIADV